MVAWELPVQSYSTYTHTGAAQIFRSGVFPISLTNSTTNNLISGMKSDTQMEDTSGPSEIDVSDAYAKRKVGRPITSERTLARNFPEIDEIRGKLLTGECFGRMRTSGNSSSVWQLFEEIAYSDSQLFTGIVRCKACAFMTRYHGQITGTSHMRRHHCFREAFPEAFTNSPKITPNVTINKIKK
ncbi:unnamed protein product, partial [Medioppia subpectinata]